MKDNRTPRSNQTKDARPRRLNSARLRMFAVVLTVFVVAGLMIALSISEPAHDLEIGAYLTEDVYATRDIYDEEATNLMRLEASAEVDRVYNLDTEIYTSLTAAMDNFFDALERMYADAHQLRKEKTAGSEFSEEAAGNLTASQWEALLTEDELEALKPDVLDALSDENVYSVLTVSENELQEWMAESELRLSSILRRGVKDSDLQATRSSFSAEMERLSPLPLRALCGTLAREFINPTLIYSETDTLIAMEEAEESVPNQYIRRGELLAGRGTKIDQTLYEQLQSMGYARDGGDQALSFMLDLFTVAALIVGIVGLILAYLPRYLSEEKKAVLTGVLLCLVILIAFFAFKLEVTCNPIFLAVIFLTLLVSGRVSSLSVVFLSVVFAFIALGPDHYYDDFARVLVSSLTGGFVGILMVRKSVRRSSIFVASFTVSLIMIIVNSTFGVLAADPFMEVLIDAAYLLGANVLCAIAGIGVMPLWESLFRVATPQRLAELSNTDQPLLRRLMLEAPGTYHHCIMVASLAESCAAAIGANELLARVGALYHDVGKLKRPLYFTENQYTNENPHDALEPERSAAVLAAHVKDGVLMLKKAKLPDEVVRIAQEHHGTTLTSFFYYKAVKYYDDPELPKAPYRYPGPRPQTRESGIVMICDSCEAAVKSLDNPTGDKVQEMVKKIIRGKMDENQLDCCPLTMSDLSKIEAAILSALRGIMHERIEYPELDEVKSLPEK